MNRIKTFEEFLEDRKKEEKKNEKVNSIYVNISNKESNYVLMIIYCGDDKYDLIIKDVNDMDDKPVSIQTAYVTEFLDRITKITQDWDADYSGKSSICWNISIDLENETKEYMGVGDTPSNWNELIDLLVRFEKIYQLNPIIEANKNKEETSDEH